MYKRQDQVIIDESAVEVVIGANTRICHGAVIHYDNDFVAHMTDVVHQLRDVPGTTIHLTFSTDTLCSCCPNKLGTDLCDTQEKVKRYDAKTVECFGLEEKDYVYQDLIREIDAKATPEILADICRDCCWFPISACCKKDVYKRQPENERDHRS